MYEWGMDFSVLQPTMFMQTLESSWKAAVKTGTFGLPYDPTKKASTWTTATSPKRQRSL